MHFKNIMYSYGVKPAENKCSRIFRPWDNIKVSVDTAQDSTVSTTTKDDENRRTEMSPEITEEKVTVTEKGTGFRPVHKLQKTKHETCSIPIHSSLPIDYPLEAYSNIYPEILQANLAQSLGLTPNDPLLVESMMQGIALEEYARVLNQEQQAKIMSSRKQRPKKYKCPHCDVGFSNNGQLKGHIRIHTGERPFKCDDKDCGKTFTRNEELTRHKRIHSGLRPFPCTHCGKRFGRKDHLKKHSRTHFQPRGLYAVPVMMPLDAWAASPSSYPFVPMFGY